jgi:hypothetical protein
MPAFRHRLYKRYLCPLSDCLKQQHIFPENREFIYCPTELLNCQFIARAETERICPMINAQPNLISSRLSIEDVRE